MYELNKLYVLNKGTEREIIAKLINIRNDRKVVGEGTLIFIIVMSKFKEYYHIGNKLHTYYKYSSFEPELL